jgi:Ca-activated chloride channel family protein
MQFLGGVQFAYPWVFLVLPFWLVLPRRRGWLLRLLAVALFVTALAGPSIPQPGRQLAILVDVSESVGDNAATAATAFDFAATYDTEIFYFASDVTRAPLGMSRSDLPFLNVERADIARALQVARASGAERMLLISGGMESQGNALVTLPDVPVDVYQVSRRPNVSLTSLLVPDEVTPGQMVEATAVIESTEAAEIELQMTVGDRDLTPVRRQVAAGRTPVPFNFVAGNTNVQLTARVNVGFDQPTIDDARTVEIAVAAEPTVLVINDPAMAQLLEAQGFSVVSGTPADVTNPFPYDAVIIRETSRVFSQGQLNLLENYVVNGGGLMMTGGEDSFGLGVWYRTPVEAVLPVNTDLRTDIEIPLVATVMVFDRSSSMRAERPSRISLARQGAVELVDLAYHEDLIGLVAFDSQHEWIFRPRQATQQGKEEMYQAIIRIEPQGGTIVGPAYQEALDALREIDAAVKHVILLTDGEFFDGRSPFSSGERPDFEAMAREGLRDGITTTTIGTGEADFATIERMARAGGGRFYAVADPRDLPQVFTSEALAAPQAIIREERLSPRLFPHVLTQNFGRTPPALEAYIATTLKPDAELLLEGLDGEPVLAISRQGLGRTAALTTDLNSWGGEFSGWSELPGVLGTVTRWLQMRPQQYSANLSTRDHRLRVTVDAVRDGQYVTGEALEARYGNERIRLEQTGPGRFEGTFDVSPAGGTVIISNREGEVARQAVNLPHTAFDPSGATELLSEIALRTGGEILPEPSLYAPLTQRTPQEVWPLLVIAGFAVFLLELIYRRFVS